MGVRDAHSLEHGSFVLHRGIFLIDPANRPRCGKRPGVAMGRYCLFVVGIGILYVWSTIGGSRSPSNRASLWVIRVKIGGEPCGDTWSGAVSLVFSKRTDVYGELEIK